MYKGYISYQRQEWDQCVSVFKPLLAQNPALANQVASPNVSNLRAGQVLEECEQGVEDDKILKSPDFIATFDEIRNPAVSRAPERTYLNPGERYKALLKCVDVLTRAFKKYPFLADYEYDVGRNKASEVKARCEAQLPEAKREYEKVVNEAAREAQAKLNKIDTLYKTGLKDFEAASKLPEKTGSEILKKEHKMGIAESELESTVSLLKELSDDSDTSTLKVGSLSFDEYLKQVTQNHSKARAALTKIESKAQPINKKFAKDLDAYVYKFSTGDRLAVLKSKGFPTNYFGGSQAVYDKIPEYSPDATFLAKYIVSATQWTYSYSSGCKLKYIFNKDKLVTLEKTYECN